MKHKKILISLLISSLVVNLIHPVQGTPQKKAETILNQTDDLISRTTPSSPSYMKLTSMRSLMENMIEDGVNEKELKKLEELEETINETIIREERARAKSMFLLIFGVSSVIVALALLTKLKSVDGEILNHLNGKKQVLTTNQIAESLDRSWATVQSHLLQMLSKGMVNHLRVGQNHGWQINKKGRGFIEGNGK